MFLISLKAGGTGLNLTAADVVIHYDPWVECRGSGSGHRQGAPDWPEKAGDGVPADYEGDSGGEYSSPSGVQIGAGRTDCAEGSVSLAGLGREELLKLLEP